MYFVFPSSKCEYRGFDIRAAEEAASKIPGGLIFTAVLPNEGERANPSSASLEHDQPIGLSSHPERRRETCGTP